MTNTKFELKHEVLHFLNFKILNQQCPTCLKQLSNSQIVFNWINFKVATYRLIALRLLVEVSLGKIDCESQWDFNLMETYMYCTK